MHKKIKKMLMLIATGTAVNIQALPNFYYAHPYESGTRFERKGLITLDGWGLYGSTRNGKDNDNRTVNVLQIYGNEKLHQVGKNVTGQNISSPNTDILDNLWRHTPTTNDGNYATLQFSGKARYAGGAVNLGINFTDSFFIGGQLPFYKLEIENPTYIDLTADADKDAQWNQFYGNFSSILSEVGLDITGHKRSGIGDAQVFMGWARSAEDLDQLDYLDATVKLGALLGTGTAKNQNKMFSFAPGYDKHHGVFLSLDTAFGFADYCSFGFKLQELFLFKRTKTMRIRSAAGQNGLIKLAKAQVNDKPGNVYEIGGYFKVEYDKVALFTGYSYDHKGAESLTAKNSVLYPSDVLNDDETMKGWSTHTLHVSAELDFTDDATKQFHPKISISYNRILRAKRAFLNHTIGGSFGIAITNEF